MFYDKESELNIFFNEKEFAIKATSKNQDFSIIFDDNNSPQTYRGSIDVNGNEINCLVKNSVISNLTLIQGDTITIKNKDYFITDIKSFSDGISTVVLNISEY